MQDHYGSGLYLKSDKSKSAKTKRVKDQIPNPAFIIILVVKLIVHLVF